ncbi:MAG: hypothetical protein AMXMBFR64_05580 [Myxococcales bacterium]
MLVRLCAEPKALIDFLGMVSPPDLQSGLADWVLNRALWCYDGSNPRVHKAASIRTVLDDHQGSYIDAIRSRLDAEPLPAVPSGERVLQTHQEVASWYRHTLLRSHTAAEYIDPSEARRDLSDFVEHCPVRTITDRYLFKNNQVPEAIRWLAIGTGTQLIIRTALCGNWRELRDSKQTSRLPAFAKSAWDAAVRTLTDCVAGRVTIRMAQLLRSESFHARTLMLGVPEKPWRYALFVDPGFDALLRSGDKRHARVGWAVPRDVVHTTGDGELTHELCMKWDEGAPGPIAAVRVRRDGRSHTYNSGDVDGNLWVRAVEDMLGTRKLEREW